MITFFDRRFKAPLVFLRLLLSGHVRLHYGFNSMKSIYMVFFYHIPFLQLFQLFQLEYQALTSSCSEWHSLFAATTSSHRLRLEMRPSVQLQRDQRLKQKVKGQGAGTDGWLGGGDSLLSAEAVSFWGGNTFEMTWADTDKVVVNYWLLTNW